MKLLHLYHDIMNLYGDYANVSAMERMLTKNGADVTVDRLSLGDKAEISDYDFIFIGSGTEKNQKTVLADFMKYKDELSEYIRAHKLLLMTGNSFEMLGKSVTDGHGVRYDALGLYNYTTVEFTGKRITADIICTASFLDKPLVGFINKSSEIFGISDSLFQTKFGVGDSEGFHTEGIWDRNFFGTHLTGPILIKNPHFLASLASLLLGREPNTDHLTYEQKGYETTLRKLSEREQAKTEG